MLAQVAVEPKALVVYSRMNGDCKLIVQDSSSLCAEGEQVSYATLQLRAQAVDQVCSGPHLIQTLKNDDQHMIKI